MNKWDTLNNLLLYIKCTLNDSDHKNFRNIMGIHIKAIPNDVICIYVSLTLGHQPYIADNL